MSDRATFVTAGHPRDLPRAKEDQMAEGWVLAAGLTALLLAISAAAVVLRARRGSATAEDGLLGLGPALVALGIIFGQDPLVGYGLIAAGVMLAVATAGLRRSAARR